MVLFSYNFESFLFHEGCLYRRNVGEIKREEMREKKNVHTIFTKKSSVILSNIKIVIISRRLYLKKNYQLSYSQDPCLLSCCRKYYGFIQRGNLAQLVART